ncbi:hypothetical protein DS901_12215 [Loktanella sp. D2R18]|uniref:hypothetical protein n=1 Tax=Rhodobacterales TaxID=204455 RepID=UPI000DEA93C5|nr:MULTISPECIES: hypothetical protein [Rhodobacterales]MDO6590188.1 hypothetical protein [Yoonia sp. 1_MG-2023]RBW42984.1 hypothetical protein DS901_12215 [Loktanella sp. D2R18]
MTEQIKQMDRHDLKAVLKNTSAAMRELGQTLTQLEEALLDDMMAGTSIVQNKPAMQTIDFLMQSIEELALMFDRMEAHEHVSGEVDYLDVIAPIRLQRIREHIAGRRARYAQISEHPSSDGISMF